MVFLGIDWAEAQHELCLTDAAGAVLARRQIPDGLAGVRQLHALVAQHAGEGAEVLVGIERDRGLLVQAVVAAGYQGSIPARTGEPVALTTRFSAGQVYPRAYGGTIGFPAVCWSKRGLSPRVRGNPLRDQFVCRRDGSIPARTGEPPHEIIGPLIPKVYPRAYGGTLRPCA